MTASASSSAAWACADRIREYGEKDHFFGCGRDAFPDMIFGGELYRDDLNKLGFLLSDYGDYLDARAAVEDDGLCKAFEKLGLLKL